MVIISFVERRPFINHAKPPTLSLCGLSVKASPRCGTWVTVSSLRHAYAGNSVINLVLKLMRDFNILRRALSHLSRDRIYVWLWFMPHVSRKRNFGRLLICSDLLRAGTKSRRLYLDVFTAVCLHRGTGTQTRCGGRQRKEKGRF